MGVVVFNCAVHALRLLSRTARTGIADHPAGHCDRSDAAHERRKAAAGAITLMQRLGSGKGAD